MGCSEERFIFEKDSDVLLSRSEKEGEHVSIKLKAGSKKERMDAFMALHAQKVIAFEESTLTPQSA